MRHRNEEDDFIVVKSTGQRVVFVAIIFVAPTHPQSLSATFLFFVPFVRRHSKPYYGSKP